MSPTVASVFLAAGFGLCVSGQSALSSPDFQITVDNLPLRNQSPVSPRWAFGQPGSRVSVPGLLLHADDRTASVELADQRVARFRLDPKTRYQPASGPALLTSFHVADFVRVESEVDGKDFLVARSVTFVRKPTASEQAEVFQSPELLQGWHVSLLASTDSTGAQDDRRLSFTEKPAAISEVRTESYPDLASTDPLRSDQDTSIRSVASHGQLLNRVRQSVNDAFGSLSSFRASQITSMFESTSRPLKWVPAGTVTAEIFYEDERESYTQVRVDGRRPAAAPEIAGPDYMRSLDRAWSTGDFETIAHCILSELADSDFKETKPSVEAGESLANYEFTGRRSSGCIGVAFGPQVTYPAYKGVMKVRPATAEVAEVEFAATDIPPAFPLDRAERSVTYGNVRIGSSTYLLPVTAYWFGCFRNSYSCFLNRIDFRDYRRFETESKLSFDR